MVEFVAEDRVVEYVAKRISNGEEVDLSIHEEMPSRPVAILEGRCEMRKIKSLSEQRNELQQGIEGLEEWVGR